MKEELITKIEVQTFLRISKRTLDNLMKAREIPFFKLKRKVLFRKSDIDKWLESKKVIKK